MNFTRKRTLRSVEKEVEMVPGEKGCKCIKTYNSSAMVSQRHTACKSSEPVMKNLGKKKPASVTITSNSVQGTSNLRDKASLKDMSCASVKTHQSKIPVALNRIVKKIPFQSIAQPIVVQPSPSESIVQPPAPVTHGPIVAEPLPPVSIVVESRASEVMVVQPPPGLIVAEPLPLVSIVESRAPEVMVVQVPPRPIVVQPVTHGPIVAEPLPPVSIVVESRAPEVMVVQLPPGPIVAEPLPPVSIVESRAPEVMVVQAPPRPIVVQSVTPGPIVAEPIPLLPIVVQQHDPIPNESLGAVALEFAEPVLQSTHVDDVELPIIRVNHIQKLQQLLLEVQFFDEQVNMYGGMYPGSDFKEMVRLTARQILSDEFLKDYSFLGRSSKLQLIEYYKVIELILKSVEKKYPGEDKSILKYFKDDYVKGAPGRYKNSRK